ncbi:LuxR C-terminal-related transcriptional regulator [Rhodococcus sp. LB1]|uniref:LuxR C-terminal-related transcriptional regulator n=1 Tax=Rhodococcus sp. LB1 TaxID=1807499 RepID=UPI00077ACE7A|nr:LuxR C-terminal-related transcriptional regulator [Rhodococcus sp. LB1]KXX55304.1 transcriptional regulator [Rhodococcus sp. LB1]
MQNPAVPDPDPDPADPDPADSVPAVSDRAGPGSLDPHPRSPASSDDPLLAARFAIPAAPKVLVRRPGLLGRLADGVRGPVTLLAGPAGAGKTVLAAQWARDRTAPRHTVWLTVEPGDAPGLFWAYLLEALDRGGVRLPVEVGRPARAEGADHSLLVRLADALAASQEPVVVVLDQFDAVSAPEVAAGVHFVAGHAAGALRLVLTARTEPLLPLHRYRAGGEITEIRNADLMFTAADAGMLLRAHGLEITEAGIARLVERTDGWAAGLRLAALAMQRSADPEGFIGAFAADRTTIADYLLSEVLAAQPPAAQELLLRACITDRLHPDLADRLTGRRDGDWTLARLARAHAFLERVDGSDWYRLHPLFAEVLRAHLAHRYPGLEPRLRSQAARWFAGTGRLTDAVTQAAAAGDWQFAAGHLVDTLAIGRLFTGLDTARLRDAFAAMPATLPGAAPALVDAARRLVDQDVPGCTAALARADEFLSAGPATPALELVRSMVGVLAGRAGGDLAATRQAAATADRLLQEVPQPLRGQHPEIPAMVLGGLGAAELGAGHLDRAEQVLTDAVTGCESPGTEQVLTDAVTGCESLGTDQPLRDCLGSLALVELLRGRLRRALAHSRRSLAVAERSAAPPDDAVGLGHLVMAGVAAEHDDRAAAHTHLDLASETAGPRPDPASAVTAAVICSRLAVADGDWHGALEILRTAETTLVRPPPQWAADELVIAASAAHLAHADPRAALHALDAVPSDRPEHAVARARAQLATGRDTSRALEVIADLPADTSAPATVRVQACLLRAQAAADDGHSDQARRLLQQALRLARPEELRRVFVESGPWVHQWLLQNPQRAGGRDWLPTPIDPSPRPADDTALPALVEHLTPRELEVLHQVAAMSSTEEAAVALSISTNTVKTHLLNLYRKLGVARRRDAVHRARDLGLL